MPIRPRSERLSASARTEAQGKPQALDKSKQAVQALRRLVDLKEVICAEERTEQKPATVSKAPQLPTMSDTPRSLRGSSVLVHSMASEEMFPSVALDDLAGQAAEAASTACSPSLYTGGGGGGSSTADERMRQLALENQALREAFGDTQKRLLELEDERQCFLDEGVYDVVNSICGQTGPSPKNGVTGLMGDVDNCAAIKSPGDAGAITFHIGSSDPSADLLALAGSPGPLSPLSLAQMVARRSEQDLRSAELSGENEKLRRELERTTKILEVLEQQRHLAEDKMLALEQEHAMLVRRLADLQQSPGTGAEVPELFSPGESSSLERRRRELQEIQRKASERSDNGSEAAAQQQVPWPPERRENRVLDFGMAKEATSPELAPSKPATATTASEEPDEGLLLGGAVPDGQPGTKVPEPWELEDAW